MIHHSLPHVSNPLLIKKRKRFIREGEALQVEFLRGPILGESLDSPVTAARPPDLNHVNLALAGQFDKERVAQGCPREVDSFQLAEFRQRMADLFGIGIRRDNSVTGNVECHRRWTRSVESVLVVGDCSTVLFNRRDRLLDSQMTNDCRQSRQKQGAAADQ